MSDDDTTECNWCGAVKDNVHFDEGHADWNGIAICNDCVSDHGYICDDCVELIHTDDTYSVNDSRTVCESCYEADYFFCEGCDYTYNNRDYGYDGYCSDCEQENESNCDCGDPDCGAGSDSDYTDGIRPWGNAPDLMFHDKNGYSYSPRANTYYLGMEIEVEGHVSTLIGDAMGERKFSDHMWATTDATLGQQGVEIVTHPHTFEAWTHTFPWKAWTDTIHAGAPDQTHYRTNGIHIHVSRTAFANSKGKVLASHLYKFMQFIQKNETAIQYLAGRTGNDYCSWSQQRDAVGRMSDANERTSTHAHERYRPINTQNQATIELRFFDGRTDPDFMKRSIQFVHSVVEFTRKGKAHGTRKWQDYARYVRGHALKYPELVSYLNKERITLVVSANKSYDTYHKVVLPNVKAELRRIKERERQERIDLQLQREQRAERLANPPICECEYCVQDRIHEQEGGIAVPREHTNIMSRPSS